MCQIDYKRILLYKASYFVIKLNQRECIVKRSADFEVLLQLIPFQC
jgi:hypothetical protein